MAGSMPVSRWHWAWSIWDTRFASAHRAGARETESRMYARDLLKVSVIYLPLLLMALMLNAK